MRWGARIVKIRMMGKYMGRKREWERIPNPKKVPARSVYFFWLVEKILVTDHKIRGRNM